RVCLRAGQAKEGGGGSAQVDASAPRADRQHRAPQVKRPCGQLMTDEMADAVHRDGESIDEGRSLRPAPGKRAERNAHRPRDGADQERAPQQHDCKNSCTDNQHRRSRLARHMISSVSAPAHTDVSRGQLLGVGLTSATLLMTELALTRIFSVVMYY